MIPSPRDNYYSNFYVKDFFLFIIFLFSIQFPTPPHPNLVKFHLFLKSLYKWNIQFGFYDPGFFLSTLCSGYSLMLLHELVVCPCSDLFNHTLLAHTSRISDLVCLDGPRICIYKKFPDEADTDGLGTTLGQLLW